MTRNRIKKVNQTAVNKAAATEARNEVRQILAKTPEVPMVKRLSIYYAHPMPLYNTKQEKRDLELLECLNYLIINPNTKYHRETSNGNMEYFYRLVRTCDVLCFRALASGRIPCGVARELNVALAHGLPVFELPTQLLNRTMSMNETMEYYHDCGNR